MQEEKEKSNKKVLILSILGVLVLIIAVVGVSYAMYTFSASGSKENVISTGVVVINFDDTDLDFNDDEVDDASGTINLTNQYPMTDTVGMEQDDPNSLLGFTVSAKLSGNIKIVYDLGIADDFTPGTTLTADYIKVALYEYQDGELSLIDSQHTIKELETSAGAEGCLEKYVLTNGEFTGSGETTEQKKHYVVKAWVADTYDLPTVPTGGTSNTQENTLEEGDVTHESHTTSETFTFIIAIFSYFRYNNFVMFMKRSEVDLDKLSPMMKQYLEIKSNYEDTILFYRIGDFYEMFFEDADIASRVLELTLTGKNSGLDERVPMCGVPYHAYLPYLEKLVNKGYKVAICEQLSDPKEKGMVKRGVIQVVTRGTIMDNGALNVKENNYIGSIYDYSYCYVLSYADISVGTIYSLFIDHSEDKLLNEIMRLNIKELIVTNNFDRALISRLREEFSILITISVKEEVSSSYNYVYSDIKDVRIVNSIKHLLAYLTDMKMESLTHLQKAIVVDKREILELDMYTKRNLELVETIRLKERTYSLLWLLDKTKTAMGSRLLKHYIENPLVDKDKINHRYDLISKMLTEFILKEELKELLNGIYDLERLSGRISYGNANARDFIQLKNSIKLLPDIKKVQKMKLKKKEKQLILLMIYMIYLIELLMKMLLLVLKRVI